VPIADVIIQGEGQFPRSLAGRWKADKGDWQFVFEPDGTISSAVVSDGVLVVKAPHRRYSVRLEEGAGGVYELGPWTVQYSPEYRELAVEVIVDHFRLDMPDFAVEGQTRDLFLGTISEDGTTWKAEWFTFPKITVLTPEAHEAPFDPNSNPRDVLTFTQQEAEG
jgi:hypothetical protein